MSAQYAAISWNPKKRAYDLLLLGGILLYIAVFVGTTSALNADATAETLIIRALGTCAFLLLHIVLCIGPLCRLDARFIPLLYNRRHLGVTTFLLGLGHGVFSIIQFHAFGDRNPLVSLFTANQRFDSVAQFPFQLLGFAALVILYVMAATSHDFWLHNLGAPAWKRIHMLVYPAYVLLVAHVTLGALQSERSPVLAALTLFGFASVVILHMVAAHKEARLDGAGTEKRDNFIFACKIEDIPEKRARIIPIGGERVAVFLYDGKVSAVSNVCRHQNGPLGEGKIIDGCITCPWHGYQYQPHNGRAPAPFKEKVETYEVQIRDGEVWVSACANASGKEVHSADASPARRESA
ncbi:MAG TPA: Rieske 2Fe-2S domain-containing protein [Candidatus Angelobacter sp.]|nr:Rieske 2Fe-2S domain-containing protein [Candidatus Angelobacter sp.]